LTPRPEFWRDEARLTKLVRKSAWTVLGAGQKRQSRQQTIYSRIGKTRTGLRAEEMVRKVSGSMLIEPSWGYIIAGGSRLLEESTGPNWTSGEKAPWRFAMPSIREARAAARAGSGKRYSTVVSLRHWWEWNYFHFWIDVLGKLSLLSSTGIDLSRSTIVVGRYAREAPFAEILGRGGLAKLDWLVADRYIAADEVIYCKTLRPYRDRLDYVMDLLEVPMHPVGQRSLFISRERAASRRIANYAAVRSVLVDQGFEEVHPEEWSFDEQVAMFSQASRVVAVTGAGLVNVAFSRSSALDVLELAGSSFVSDDFGALCAEYGYGWQRLVGRNLPGRAVQHTDIAIDVDELRRALSEGAPGSREGR